MPARERSEIEKLEALIRELPPGLIPEVIDFVEFLLHRRARPKQKYVGQSWAGGLSELRDQYTSLELQQQVIEWRIEKAMGHSTTPDEDREG